jgi:hypothetical protein
LNGNDASFSTLGPAGNNPFGNPNTGLNINAYNNLGQLQGLVITFGAQAGGGIIAGAYAESPTLDQIQTG